MTEVTKLPFDTQMGPIWPAAMYVATCAWPDSLPQRTKLFWALLHAGARGNGYRYPGPDARVIDRRCNRGAERLHYAFQAAEVAQLALLPAEIKAGPITLSLPSRHAVGPSGEVSVKRLQALAASGWAAPHDPRDLALGDDDFRTRVWRRYLPAMPYIIPLKLYLREQEHAPKVVTLVRNVEWLEPALQSAERWAAALAGLENVPADFIRLAPRLA